MPSHPIANILVAAANLAFLMMLAGIFASWAWILGRVFRDRPLLPDEPFCADTSRWGLGTIMAMLVLEVGSAMLVAEYSRPILGIDAAALYKEMRKPPAPPSPDLPPEEHKRWEKASAERSSDLARQSMTLNLAAQLLLLASFPLVLLVTSGARLADLGLTTKRWGSQVFLGVVGGLAIIPVGNLIQAVALRVFPSNPHPVEKMLSQGLDAPTAALAVVSAVILAPIKEEAIFRGILQRGFQNLASSSANAAISRAGEAEKDAEEVSPRSEVVAMASIAATSFIFAGLHGAQWPSPIALFVFSLVVGYLYHRTGSLLTAISYHAVFNGFSTLMILGLQLEKAVEGPAIPNPTPIPAPVGLIWDWLVRLST